MRRNGTGYGLLELMNDVYELIVWNICYLVACLPIVTIGAATTALYTVLGRKQRGEGRGLVRPFFRALRENFRMATRFWIPQMVLLAGCGAGLALAGQGTMLRGGCVAGLVLASAVGSFLYPQIARYENRTRAYFRNAVLLVLAKPGWMVLNLLVLFTPVWLLWLLPNVFWRLGFVWISFGIAALFSLSARITRRAMRPLEPQEPEEG